MSVVSRMLLLCAITPILPAAYSNLIASDDGRSVYFSAPGGIFVFRMTDSGPPYRGQDRSSM